MLPLCLVDIGAIDIPLIIMFIIIINLRPLFCPLYRQVAGNEVKVNSRGFPVVPSIDEKPAMYQLQKFTERKRLRAVA